MHNLHILKIKNGTVWDGVDFRSGDVLIQDGKIAAVGDCGDVKPDFEFDASGCLVTPGLIDIHTHMRGISDADFGTPIEAVSFPSGVTAAAEAGAAFGDKALLDSFMVKSKVFVSLPVQDDHVKFDNAEKLLAKYGDRAIGVKLFFEAREGQVQSVQPLKEICAFARAHGLKVMVHSTGTPVPMAELLQCLSEGDICTHAYHGGVNSAAADGFRCLKEARERGVVIDAGLAGGVHADFEVLKQAIQADALPDTVSTDITRLSAFVRGGHYNLTLCMGILRALGMSEREILRSVTRDAARAIGLEQQCGVLEAGRCADVAVLRLQECPYNRTDNWGNTLSFDEGYRCLLTIADGQVVFRSEAI